MTLDDQLRQWAEEERRAPPPSPESSAALVAVAERRESRRPLLPLLMLGAAATAALLLLLLLPDPPESAPALVEAPEAPAPELPSPPPEDELVLLLPGEISIGGDTLLIEPESEVRIVERSERLAAFALEAGAVTAVVAPRAPGQSFVVRSGEHEVRVVGTRFRVTHAPFTVAVEEGVVEVIGSQTWRVRAGERFEDGEVRRPQAAPPAPPPLPSVEELRAALLAGQLDQAREGLERRLARAPGEVDAWTLLAQAERKAGRTAEAVRAWREVIARGAPAEAQRARFEAARLLEAQPAEAEPLLRAFLQTPDPLAAEARLRLGKAILAQGRRDEAAQTLEVLVSEHPGSASARAARALLEEIRSEGER